MKKSVQNQKGSVLLLVIVGVLVAAGIGFVLLQPQTGGDNQVGSLPSVEKRTNPEPTSQNRVFVSVADPGQKVTVDEVSLEKEGYVYIYLDSAGEQTLIGKTQLLKAGTHTNVSISLTSTTKDGDVVFVSLVDKDGAKVLDENKNAIEMQRNVGVVMSHYENEY